MCCFHVGYQKKRNKTEKRLIFIDMKKRNTGLAYCGRWDSFGKSWIFSWKNSTGTNGHRRACGRSVSSDQQIDTGGFRIW